MAPQEPKSNQTTTQKKDNGAPQCPTPISIAPDLLKALQARFKLTETQSRAYTALLASGQLTADEVSIYSGVPFVKGKSVIEALQKKQLIKTLPGVVTRYRAFAPYREFADEVQTFTKETQVSEKELQKLQVTTSTKIRNECQAMNQQIRSTLESLNERQGIALSEAAMTINIVLNNVAENLQKSLTSLSQLGVDEFSNQNLVLQNTLQELIDRIQTQLDEAQSVALEDIMNVLLAHQEETEEWVTSVSNQSLLRSDGITQQAKTYLSDANIISQRTINSGLKTATMEVTSYTEGISEITEETAISMVTGIEAYNHEVQKALNSLQKELNEELTKNIQGIIVQIHDAWTQRTQALDKTLTEIEQRMKRDYRGLTQKANKASTEMGSAINSARETTSQNNETLFKELKNALEMSGQEYSRLHKKAETTIAQWPPTSLNFSQFSKIQSSLTTLMEQVKTENERIIDAASKDLGIEMRDTYLAQLLEVQTIVKNLIAELQSHRGTLETNYKSIADQVVRRIKRRLNTVRKTTETFLLDFQAKIDVQEAQRQTLNKRLQKLLTQQAGIVMNALESTETQIGQYAEERIKQAQSALKKSTKENITKATRSQKVVEKHLQSFDSALKKLRKVTTSELQHEFQNLENIVNQYSEGIESTADRLREVQRLRVESTITGYQPAINKTQSTRDIAMAKAINSVVGQLLKRDQRIIKDLSILLPETIMEYTAAALNTYQTALNKEALALETEAAAKAQSTVNSQVTPKRLKSLNTQMSKAISTQLNTITEEFQTFLTKQQTQFDKESTTAFKQSRKQFIEIEKQQIGQVGSLVEIEFKEKIAPIIRKCRTKMKRQTQRDKQVEDLFQTTKTRLLQLPKALLAKEKKAVRDKLTSHFATILQEFKDQLLEQTNREAQISTIFQSTLTELEQLPEILIHDLAEQQLNEQASDLQSALTEYLTALDNLQKNNAKTITNEIQSIHSKLLQVNYAKSLKTQLRRILRQNTKITLDTYQNYIKTGIIELETQASTTFQAALDKQLQTKLPANLNEYLGTQAPTIKEPIENMGTKLSEVIEKYDSDSRTLENKYWIPLTKIIDEYSATVAGNLNALNTAIGSTVDQASVNVTTSLSNYGDDANNLLTVTAQSFERERTGLTEQITQGINEMQTDCLAQLQETKSLLEGLTKDIRSQKSTLTQKMDKIEEEVDTATTANLDSIRETADSFVENIRTELQEQGRRIQRLTKNVQDLILKQGMSSSAQISGIQMQLESFTQNQIPRSQIIIEEIGETCTTRIDEQRKAVDNNLSAFAKALSEETDDYITTLQQEIVQLQTVTSKLIEQVGTTSEAINTGLIDVIESNRVKMRSAIDDQQTSLSKDITSTLQTFSDEYSSTQSQLQATLTQMKEEGVETLAESSTQINTTLNTTLNNTLSKSAEVSQTHQENISTKSNALTTQLQENLSAVGEKVSSGSNQLIQTLTTVLSGSQTELNKIFSDSEEAIDEENQKAITELGGRLEQSLQTFSQTLDLIKTRLARIIQDNTRHNTEAMQNFKEVAARGIQQQSGIIIGTIKQILDSAEEGLVTQTQKTGRRITRTFNKERQTLKTEYQTLKKEMTAKTEAVENSTITNIQSFTQKILPLLNRIQNQAADTEQVLIGLWEAVSSLQPAEADRTWRIVTCEGIQNHLLDMFRRIDETITLVYPSFDEVPITELSKIQSQNRVHIITTLNGDKQLASARKLLQQGNIRIWNNPNMEFYGGSRDGKEVLIAPTYGNQGEIVAVVSDQASYIALFNRTLGPRWISASEEIQVHS